MISFANFNVNHKVLRNLSEKLDYKNPTAFQKLYGKEVISKKQNFIETKFQSKSTAKTFNLNTSVKKI